MAEALLVTGFPGFIGERLVGALLADREDARVIALAEERMADKAREVAQRIDSRRIEVLAGDITDRRLGVGDGDYDRLRAEVTAVFHLAAVYDLAVPFDVAQRVNIEGTGNVLELCLAAERLERLNYVSTAYVAGTRQGVVYEHELALGQGFKNHYESTKFQAEVWVRHVMDRVPTTIYRPAIVVGDSRTGETKKFDGPYFVLRAISGLSRRRVPVPQIGTDAPFNVVPVDVVVKGMVQVSSDPEAVGDTLHLVDSDPLSSAELVEVLAGEYGDVKVGPSLPPAAVDASLRVKPVREAMGGIPRESLEYLAHAPSFDTRRADELLHRHDIRSPNFRQYAPAMVRFFREHEDDPDYA